MKKDNLTTYEFKDYFNDQIIGVTNRLPKDLDLRKVIKVTSRYVFLLFLINIFVLKLNGFFIHLAVLLIEFLFLIPILFSFYNFGLLKIKMKGGKQDV